MAGRSDEDDRSGNDLPSPGEPEHAPVQVEKPSWLDLEPPDLLARGSVDGDSRESSDANDAQTVEGNEGDEAEIRAAMERAGAEYDAPMPPRVEQLLDGAGLTADERTAWVSELRALRSRGHTEDDLVAVLLPEELRTSAATNEPAPNMSSASLALAKKSELRRVLTLQKHELARWWRGQNPFLRVLYTAAWFYLLLTPLLSGPFSWATLVAAIFVVGAKAKFVLGDSASKTIKLVLPGYDTRKLLLESLIQRLQVWTTSAPSRHEVETFQQDALKLIANYVRSHRGDVPGQTIFANLAVCHDAGVAVIARSDQRPVPEYYPRGECELVWDAIAQGTPQLTGHLYMDFPLTKEGKKYNSIIALPINFRGKVLGAVSIDSQAMYHFDAELPSLTIALAPYVQLLAITLTDAYDKSSPVKGAVGSGGEEHHAGDA